MKLKVLFILALGLLSVNVQAGTAEQLRYAIRITLPESYGTPIVTSVREGVFGVNTDGKWTFYRIGGGIVHHAHRCKFNSQNPLFDSRALVMQDLESKARSKPYVILYVDGTKKQLPEEWKDVTDFVDGVAMVKAFDSKFIPRCFYINTKGEEIWPHLKVVGRSMTSLLSTYPVRPLRDNRRAFKKDGKWGFLDERGNIVIKPQFLNVRDFSEGYAGVTTTVNGKSMIGFINQAGEFTFPPILKGYNIWDEKVGDVHSGRIRVLQDGTLAYYNTKGEKLKVFKDAVGTEFMPGNVAWICERAKLGDTCWMNIVDPNFKTVHKVDESKGRWGILDNPIFSKHGFKTATFGREIITPLCDVVINGKDDFSDNLKDYYAFFGDDAISYCYAELMVEDKKYYGFIGQNGNYAVIFDRPTKPTTWKRNKDTTY